MGEGREFLQSFVLFLPSIKFDRQKTFQKPLIESLLFHKDHQIVLPRLSCELLHKCVILNYHQKFLFSNMPIPLLNSAAVYAIPSPPRKHGRLGIGEVH